MSNASQVGTLNREVKELNQNMLKVIGELEIIKSNSNKSFVSKFLDFFKKKEKGNRKTEIENEVK